VVAILAGHRIAQAPIDRANRPRTIHGSRWGGNWKLDRLATAQVGGLLDLTGCGGCPTTPLGTTRLTAFEPQSIDVLGGDCSSGEPVFASMMMPFRFNQTLLQEGAAAGNNQRLGNNPGSQPQEGLTKPRPPPSGAHTAPRQRLINAGEYRNARCCRPAALAAMERLSVVAEKIDPPGPRPGAGPERGGQPLAG